MDELPPEDRLSSGEISLFKEALEHDGVIRPEPDARAHTGHSYPQVLQHLGLGPNADLRYLRYRLGHNLLRRRFRSRDYGGWSCVHSASAFRDACPLCGSARVRVVRLLRHLGCGAEAPRSHFEQRRGLICPSCHQPVRGDTDQQDLGRKWLCDNCAHRFDAALAEGRCVRCNRLFFLDDRRPLDAHSYFVTAAVIPALAGKPWRQDQLVEARDDIPGVLSEEALMFALKLEMRRARSYGDSLSVLVMDTWILRRGRAAPRSVEAVERLYEFAQAVEQTRRKTDVVGRLSTGELVFVLPETPIDNVPALTSRLFGAVGSVVGDESLRMGIATLEHEVDEPADLLDQAFASRSFVTG